MVRTMFIVKKKTVSVWKTWQRQKDLSAFFRKTCQRFSERPVSVLQKDCQHV